eukprot:246-Alexandrium_andersonii.AAC.1
MLSAHSGPWTALRPGSSVSSIAVVIIVLLRRRYDVLAKRMLQRGPSDALGSLPWSVGCRGILINSGMLPSCGGEPR